MRVAFFDMDRTILSQNSGTSWLRFQYKRGELSPTYMARAVYWQLLYRLAVLDMESLATRLVSDLEGSLEAEMLHKCQEWLEWELASLISPAAVAQIERHKQELRNLAQMPRSDDPKVSDNIVSLDDYRNAGGEPVSGEPEAAALLIEGLDALAHPCRGRVEGGEEAVLLVLELLVEGGPRTHLEGRRRLRRCGSMRGSARNVSITYWRFLATTTFSYGAAFAATSNTFEKT